jgi:hypothetical protein
MANARELLRRAYAGERPERLFERVVPEALDNDSYEQAKKDLAQAIKSFPKEFGLRAFPGKKFRVGVGQSFVGSQNNTYIPMIYTQVYDPELAKRHGYKEPWMDFAKGTVEELKREIVKAPKVEGVVTEAINLGPAYGRDYKSAKDAKADFLADKDFIILDAMHPYHGKPANMADLRSAGERTVNLRYNRNRGVVVVNF